MSNTLSLFLQVLALGAIALLGLGARWAWLSHKHKRHRALHPQTSVDAFLSSELGSALDGMTDKAAEASSPQSQETSASQAFQFAPRLLDPRIDCIAHVQSDESQSALFIMNHLPATRRIGSKPWHIEAAREVTSPLGEVQEIWETPQANQSYKCVQLGLQLVNRHGAMHDVEYSEFLAMVEHLATGMNASTQLPEMQPEVARAKALEQFVLAHSIRLSLNLHAKKAAWSLPFVQQQALKAGFVAGVIPGRWVIGRGAGEMIALCVESRAALAALDNPVPLSKLTLTLDVAQVSGDWEPFGLMSDVAIKLCATMDAQMLDENGLLIDAAALDKTAQELQVVYAALEASGLPAGSAAAKRLFA